MENAKLPGTPRWNQESHRFEETVEIDPAFLEGLGLRSDVELGYSYFEPPTKRQLYILRGIRPGYEKTVQKDKGKATQRDDKWTIWLCAVLQDVTGKLYGWDVSAKGAYLQFLSALAPPGVRNLDNILLLRDLEARVPVWIHKTDETWTIKLGTPADLKGAMELLATVGA